MNDLIDAFIRNQGAPMTFYEADRVLWLSYKLLTDDDHRVLKEIGFAFKIQKETRYKEVVTKKWWGIKKVVDKQPYIVYSVTMYSEKRKPTLEKL